MNVKDRLTAHNEVGQGIINMDGVKDELEARARIRSFSPLIISRLTEYEDTGMSPDEINALKSENAALRERLERSVELPAKVMIERTLINGKFKPTQKAQAFNGRIGVVYRDETRWKGLLVDICSEKTNDYKAAEARLAELKGEEE